MTGPGGVETEADVPAAIHTCEDAGHRVERHTDKPNKLSAKPSLTLSPGSPTWPVGPIVPGGPGRPWN